MHAWHAGREISVVQPDGRNTQQPHAFMQVETQCYTQAASLAFFVHAASTPHVVHGDALPCMVVCG
jgi:hypothetical protein